MIFKVRVVPKILVQIYLHKNVCFLLINLQQVNTSNLAVTHHFTYVISKADIFHGVIKPCG